MIQSQRIKRVSRYGLTIIACTTLIACVSPTEKVMPPLAYNQPIEHHSQHHLNLVWKSGDIMAADRQTEMNNQGSIAANLMASAIDNWDRKQRPSRYHYTYGKAQQTVFMQSLKNTLENQGMFKTVDLSAAPKSKLANNDTEVTIEFTHTRVGEEKDGLPITLAVRVQIHDNHHQPFTKEYVASSQPKAHTKAKTFVDRQTEASEKLMQKVIRGIELWLAQSDISAKQSTI